MDKKTDKSNHRQHDGGEVIDNNTHLDLKWPDTGNIAEIHPGKVPCYPEGRIVGLYDYLPEDVGRYRKCCSKNPYPNKIAPAWQFAIKKDKNDK